MRYLKKSELKEFLFFSVYQASGMVYDIGYYNSDIGLVKKNRKKDSDFEKFATELLNSDKKLPLVVFSEVDENYFIDSVSWKYATNFQFDYVDDKNKIYDLYRRYLFATAYIGGEDWQELDDELRKDDLIFDNLYCNDEVKISQKSSVLLSFLTDTVDYFLNGANNANLNEFIDDKLDDFRL